jgi:glycosyltransferase involved in cell wall biosynthesis
MRNPVRLLYPSHYEWHKNFPLLAGVLNLAKASRSPLHLTLTVSGTERLGDATLRDVFSSVASNVTFLGSVPPDALPALYESHDVLVFPSLVESFGLPLLEAMTSNMPIVASDRTWAREICQFAATYADPYSPQHWIDAITHVIKQTVRENKSGRIRALEFDWDKAADRYVELIEQLLH